MKVLFWGTPAFALPALRALSEEGHVVVGVVTQPDRPAGRGREVAMSPVKQEALAEGIPVLQPEKARGDEFMARIRALDADVSVVVAFGQILKPEVLAVPRLGSINIHASLLPELRGAAPIQWAIVRGHTESGVTIMRMEAGLDSGPMLLRVEEPIQPEESASELGARLAEIGAEALVETLALMESGGIGEEPQDHARATYAPKVDRDTARLDWSLPADEVALWIRGMDDVPGAWSPLEGRGTVKLFRPKVVEDRGGAPGEVLRADEDGVVIACGFASVRVREVQPPGKRRMPAADWVRGRGVRAGDRFEAHPAAAGAPDVQA
ncbi:methionyl-tRNA formyltransferase [Longimicrobium sp.]|uniref:methionyl-tRNA formyltransferase n=1 Tax=Longimicrobium sp. TaxID=2029185 RepID=UPI002E2F2684|nr:methionyl-tRNA formyltransferase [Longimicrobium sp.]HEX6041789.1 methionyl-tRNA formyltransferase [Longimicrobium sp.]